MIRFRLSTRRWSPARWAVACDAVILDFHAETSSEKMAMGHFCDGRASLVVGTHTHVPTADHHILKGGTAYQTDAGMCGDYDSVIGMDKAEPMQRFLRKTARSSACGLRMARQRCVASSLRRMMFQALRNVWLPSVWVACWGKQIWETGHDTWYFADRTLGTEGA